MPDSPEDTRWSPWRHGLLLAVAALLPYAHTWGYPFINLDDQASIVGLALIRELNFQTLPDFFRPVMRPGLIEYMPLKNLSYAVDYAFFGLWAPGYRIQQLLLYLASVLLFWRYLTTLVQLPALRDRPGFQDAAGACLAAALLFAVHPAHVESVTWLSGRKDVLSGVLVFACLLCGLRYTTAPEQSRDQSARSRKWLAGALLCLVLALLSKPMAVVLPLLLLAQDRVVQGDRPLWTVLRERLALHLPATALCGGFVAFYLLIAGPALADPRQAERLFDAPAYLRWGQQLLIYAQLSLLPMAMSPIHPPEIFDGRVLSAMNVAGVMMGAALVAASVWAWRRRHPLLLGLVMFGVPLSPVILNPPWGQ